jgi:hypothetical protein
VKIQAIFLIFLTIVFAAPSLGQEADSFYLFAIECSQEPVLGGETIIYTLKFPPQANQANIQ